MKKDKKRTFKKSKGNRVNKRIKNNKTNRKKKNQKKKSIPERWCWSFTSHWRGINCYFCCCSCLQRF